jgi:acetylornithine deacetylase/succinyl-diaminopimelate desuccinylase-like protein
VQAYGLSPFPMSEEDSRRVHADDERIPLASFDKGVTFIARVVSEFAASR